MILDIIARGIFIPFIWIFIFKQTPEFKADIKEWIYLLRSDKKKAKRKTVKVQSRPMVTYSNSFSN